MTTCEEKKIELIESLTEEKSFEELSNGERILVLEVLGSYEEFVQMRKLAHELSGRVRLLNTGLVPDPGVLKTIKERSFIKKEPFYRSGSWLNAFRWQLSVPVYQIGLAAVVLIFLFQYFTKPERHLEQPMLVETVVPDTIKVLQTKKDTVYLEKIIVKTVTPKIHTPVKLEGPVVIHDIEQLISADDYLSMVNDHKGFSLEEKSYLLNLSTGNE